MTISSQLTSLDLSKKLAELGVKAESMFSWSSPQAHWSSEGWIILETGTEAISGSRAGIDEGYHAYSVAELGEILPKGIRSVRLDDYNKKETWVCEGYGHSENADTEADARAKMLLHLISSGIIEAPKK